MVELGKWKKASASQIITHVLMLLLALLTIYPFWYCLIYSFSEAMKAAATTVVIVPAGFTLRNYQAVFQVPLIHTATLVSIFRTLGGTVYSVLITGLASYALSKYDLPGNRLIALFLIIPMYISGGLLPYYVVITKLGLSNNLLVYILPHGFYAFNMVLMRAYFDTIPPELGESARLDGASELTIFFRIIFQVSKPIFSVIAMLNGVWQWNAWFDGLLYITKPQLRPLQNILQSFLSQSEAEITMVRQGLSGALTQQPISPETIRMTILIVTVLPIIFIYPFFQKYFIRGIMLGAVKA